MPEKVDFPAKNEGFPMEVREITIIKGKKKWGSLERESVKWGKREKVERKRGKQLLKQEKEEEEEADIQQTGAGPSTLLFLSFFSLVNFYLIIIFII